MRSRHESMGCPFMNQQNKKGCPMAYNDMPYQQDMYEYEEEVDDKNMYMNTYEDNGMWEEKRCPMYYNRYPMMMPMPMVMEFEDDDE